MKLEHWQALNEHLKMKFSNSSNIQTLDFLPLTSQEKIDKIDDVYLSKSNLYKIRLVCMSINIDKFNNYSYENKTIILSEFIYCISKIMNLYNVKHINVTNNNIEGIFEIKETKDFEGIFECATDLNTFRFHLNKAIHKYLLKNQSSEINYGIGIWFSYENYFSIIEHSDFQKNIFIGESIDFSNKITNNIEYNISLNELMYINFSDEYLEKNKQLIENTYSIINNEKIYGSNSIFLNYFDWIKKNT